MPEIAAKILNKKIIQQRARLKTVVLRQLFDVKLKFYLAPAQHTSRGEKLSRGRTTPDNKGRLELKAHHNLIGTRARERERETSLSSWVKRARKRACTYVFTCSYSCPQSLFGQKQSINHILLLSYFTCTCDTPVRSLTVAAGTTTTITTIVIASTLTLSYPKHHISVAFLQWTVVHHHCVIQAQ